MAAIKRNPRELRNVKSQVAELRMEIRDKIHIFGVKPECNMYFAGRE